MMRHEYRSCVDVTNVSTEKIAQGRWYLNVLVYIFNPINWKLFYFRVCFVYVYLGNHIHTNGISNGNVTNHARPTLDVLDSPGIKRRSRHAAKLNMGDTKDDIHVCIMCLRAIMNNKVRT